MRRSTVLLAFLGAVVPALAAGSPAAAQRLPIVNLTTDDGLAASQVWDVHRDRRGYVWIATSEGLNRFDGVALTALTAVDGLRSQVVRRVVEDELGNLWLATSEGLARYDGKGFAFWGKPEGVGGGIVWDLAFDRHGNLWFGTAQGGLGVLTGAARRQPPAAAPPGAVPGPGASGIRWYGQRDGLAADDVYSLLPASDGALWVGTRAGGAARCRATADGELRGCRVLGTPDGLPQGAVRALVEDASGAVWLGIRGGGVSRFAGGRLTTFTTRDGLAADDVYALLVRRSGELAIGTAGAGVTICALPGLARCRTIDRDQGLAVDAVLGLDEDSEGNLWIGLNNGLSRLASEKLQGFDQRHGLPGPGGYAVLPEPDGAVWLATFGGLARVRLREPYAPPAVEIWTGGAGLPSSEVWDVLRDRAGRLWVGTARGLCRFDEREGRCAEVIDETVGMAGSYVLELMEARNGDLWVGTLTGATRLRTASDGSRSLLPFTAEDGLAGGQVQSIAEDPRGTVWLACSGGGLSAFEGGRMRSWIPAPAGGAASRQASSDMLSSDTLPSANIYGLHAAEDGTLWIGTGGAGLVRARRRADGELRFDRVGLASGLSAPTVSAIRPDGRGRLWVGSTAGIWLFDPRRAGSSGAVLRHFDKDSGLISKDVSTANSLALDSRGRVWCGFSGGLGLYDPALEEPPAATPRIAIERVAVGNLRVLRAPFSPPPRLGAREEWLDANAPVGLPPKGRNLRFDFRGLSARGALLYRTRLDGFDEGWSEPTREAFKEYTNLDPGSYRFRVQAAGATGWGPAAELALALRPAFWQTPGFAGLVLLAVALLLAAAYRWRTRVAHARTAELEALVAERTDDLRRYARALEEHSRALDRANARIRQTNRYRSQFLANMSHELRTPLNAIIGFTQVLQRRLDGRIEPRELGFLDNVHDSGRHLLQLINNLLDLSKVEAGRMEVHVEQTELGAVVRGVCAVMEGYCRERGVTVVQQLPPHLAPIAADAPKLRQILFNLLSNAIKFSEPGSVVQVEGRMVPEQESRLGVDAYELVVIDHGIGIPPGDQATIFEEFRQAHPRGDRPHGSGLGLAIVYRFVALLGGEVDLDSAPGRGTTFRVLLPRQPEGTVSARRLAIEAEHPAARPRVLVVADDRVAFAALAGAIEEGGFLPVRARDGEEALRISREVHPSVVVLDLALPWGEGWGALAALAGDERHGRLPVVLAALGEGPEVAVAIAFDECLLQPVDPPALAAALRRHTPPEAREQGVPVLLVDDDPSRRETLELALAAAGLAGLAAADRRTAIELARVHHPRAVVLSLSMPPLETFALARSLQRDARTARLPLVAILPRDVPAGERQRIARELATRLDRNPRELVAALEVVLARGHEGPEAAAPPSVAGPR